MSLRINQNISALTAHRYQAANDAAMSKSIEKLSSGLRINSAADDAAGLVISEQLRTQISGLTQATQNTTDGVNMVKTTESALNEIEVQLRNMRDLTLHASSANGNAQMLAADQAQFAQASASIDRISQQTQFAGRQLLDASTNISGAVFQIGANNGQTATFSATGTFDGATVTANMSAGNLGVSATGGNTGSAASVVAKLAAATITGADEHLTLSGDATHTASVTLTAGDTAANQVTKINAAIATTHVQAVLAQADGTISPFGSSNTYIKLISATAIDTPQNGTTLSAISDKTAGAGTTGIGTTALQQTGASTAAVDISSSTSGVLNTIDSALKKVNGLRVQLGAFQSNNLESNLNELAVVKENTTASESAIRDTDMAAEMVNFTKSQILTQAAQAMLTQANQAPQSILQMLR